MGFGDEDWEETMALAGLPAMLVAAGILGAVSLLFGDAPVRVRKSAISLVATLGGVALVAIGAAITRRPLARGPITTWTGVWLLATQAAQSCRAAFPPED